MLDSPPQPPGAHDVNIPKGPADANGGQKALAVGCGDGAHQEMGAEMPMGGSKPRLLNHAQAGVPERVRHRIQAAFRAGYVDGHHSGKLAGRARILGFPHPDPH